MMAKKKKTVLITAGGTIAPIDDVRHIGNFSSGAFPMRLAEAALKDGYRVIYLHAKKAKTPFADDFIFNPEKSASSEIRRLKEVQKTYRVVHSRLQLVPFKTFDEYAAQLEGLLKKVSVDIVLLAAAVSDYGVKAGSGKISSERENITLKLHRNPKLIISIKQWARHPVFQVGFKLLSGVSEDLLVETAYKAGLASRSNLTFANDLVAIRAGKREIVAVTPERGAIRFSGPRLVEDAFAFVARRAGETFFTTVTKEVSFGKKVHKKEYELFRTQCAKLVRRGFMTPFFFGSDKYHGSLALRLSDDSFLITSRGSDKRNLKYAEMVRVTNVDWRTKKVFTESAGGEKPSFNAVLVAKIFEQFPEVSVFVHGHVFVDKRPTTSFAHTPGTLEYATAPQEMLKRNRIVNLRDHGFVAQGSDLEETVNYAIKQAK